MGLKSLPASSDDITQAAQRLLDYVFFHGYHRHPLGGILKGLRGLYTTSPEPPSIGKTVNNEWVTISILGELSLFEVETYWRIN